MNPIDKACEIAGSQRSLSTILEVSPATVNQWCSGERPIPIDRCPAIEIGCAGAVLCEELRPDVNWVRVPDPAWPHHHGRPLVDYAKLGAGGTTQTMKEAA